MGSSPSSERGGCAAFNAPRHAHAGARGDAVPTAHRPHGARQAAGHAIPVALSRQELAETVGTIVESAMRVMSLWNREGVLFTGRDWFVIPQPRAARARGSGRRGRVGRWVRLVARFIALARRPTR